MKTINHKPVIIIGFIVMMMISIGALHFSRVLYINDPQKVVLKDKVRMQQVIEGDITDRNGNIIMQPTEPLGENSTVYENCYSYILGHNHAAFGQSGLRALYKTHLYNDEKTGKGGSIQLTINDSLQEEAYDLLKEHEISGSLIVLDAENGEILAMASKRDIELDWDYLNSKKYKMYQEHEDMWGNKKMFLDPATSDNDAPGSVFKVVTSCCAIENGKGDFIYHDEGVLKIGSATIKNAGNSKHDNDGTLQDALVNSTNTYFALLSTKLKANKMRNIAKSFLIGKKINLGFTSLNSTISFEGGAENLAMIGFGQGTLALSPLHIAMIGQSIVNDGEMLMPVIVKSLCDAKGRILFNNTERTVLNKAIKAETATEVKKLMHAVTEAKFPEFLNYTENVYCKTGTAEVGKNKEANHAYLMCMTDEYSILASCNDTKSYGGNLDVIVEPILEMLYANE